MPNRVEIRFHGRLQQLRSSAEPLDEYRFHGSPAVKDAIEALGVPHTEVDLILVNGFSVPFEYRLQDADRLEIYPFASRVEIAAPLYLCPSLPEEVAFILDVHLGKLARRLRMLGFDCRYRNDYSDPQIIELALAEGLIILTRDRGILKHSRVRQGLLLLSGRVEEQVREVLWRYRLHRQIRPLSRCPACNGRLEAVAKEEIRSRLQPKTERYYQDFRRCRKCGQLYWQGSHYAKIEAWLRQLQSEQ